MNILFIITGLGTGGAEIQVCNLADEFARKGHNISIVALNGNLPNSITPQNKNIKIQTLFMKKTIGSFFKTLKKLKQIVQENQFDVVHSHMFHANIMARMLKIICPIKLVCTAHSTNEGGKFRMLLYRITHRFSDLNTNVSQEAVQAFERQKAVPKAGMIAVSNGIDTEIFSPSNNLRETTRKELNITNEKYLFLNVGRLTQAKDQTNLIQAFEKIYTQNHNCHLAIAGTGELKETLQNLVNKKNLTHAVSFLGIRKDIPNLMNACDTFVLSSQWEGLPLVIGEAMACEKIVIATDCGGVKEVVGTNGFLVPIKNSNELAQTMQKVMDISEKEKQTIQINARKSIIEKYSLQNIAKQWLNLYKTI